MYVLLLLLPMTIYGLIEEDAMPTKSFSCSGHGVHKVLYSVLSSKIA
jgi:hypothetical protein